MATIPVMKSIGKKYTLQNLISLGKTRLNDLRAKNEAEIHGANLGEESRKTQKNREKRAFIS
jgi:hypothetical protein